MTNVKEYFVLYGSFISFTCCLVRAYLGYSFSTAFRWSPSLTMWSFQG